LPKQAGKPPLNNGRPAYDSLTDAVSAPAPTPLAGAKAALTTTPSTQDGDGNDISVLLASNRLQITADVDAAGLEKLEKMLAKYKEILKLQ
jgi:hypothetical protein